MTWLVRAVWALVAPLVGPWMLAAMPWLAGARAALSGVSAAVWRIAGTAVLSIAVGLALAHWWHGDAAAGRTMAAAECDAANVRAELDATKRALDEAGETVRWREDQIRLSADAITRLEKEREALRAAHKDSDAPVFDAADDWLRSARR